MIATNDAATTGNVYSEAFSKEERIWAMLCHISSFSGYLIPLGNILAPLIIWYLKREESELIDDQGKEAFNFQVSLTLYFILSVILILFVIGIPLLIGLLFFHVIVTLIAAIRANDGEKYRYPFTIRFVD